MNHLAITELRGADAPDVRRLLDEDAADYRQYFVAFDTDVAHIAETLDRAERDRYWGIKADGRLIGLVMLRGLDEGFTAPAFGVYVAQSHASRGLGRLALEFATTWCRLNECGEMMLTVHPAHAAAVHLYEQSGFQFTGHSSPRGYHIYRKTLS